MSDISLHIARLNAKLQQLLRQHEQLLHENKQQKETITKLSASDQTQKEEIILLQQQSLVFKASLSAMDEKEKKVLEQKINGYLRNIDKCISLLSHKQNT